MKLEKAIYTTVIVNAAVLVATVLPQTSLMPFVIKRLEGLHCLNSADPKALVFFLVAQCFVVNYVFLRVIGSVGSKHTRKSVRSITSNLTQSCFLTFTNVVCAYIFKVDMDYLLRSVIFVQAAIYGMVASSLLGITTAKLFFLACTISTNLFLFSFTFLKNYTKFHTLLTKYAEKFKFTGLVG